MSRGRVVAAALALVCVGLAVWALAGKGRHRDPFNECLALTVQTETGTTRKVDIELPQALLRLFTGQTGGGEGAALKLSVEGTDRAAFRALSDRETGHLIDACAARYGRTLGPLNAEIQVWAEIGGQKVGHVQVIRVLHSGDFCTTDANGTCPLTLHDVKPGRGESFTATSGDLTATQAADAETLAGGVVTVQLASGGRATRAVLVTHKQELLAGVDVSIDERGAGVTIRSAACLHDARFGAECAHEGTGSDGKAALFSMPDDLAGVAVMLQRGADARRCRAVAEGASFRVDWDACGAPTPPPSPPAQRCSDATLAAVRSFLSLEPRRSQMTQASVTLRFHIAGGVMKKIDAAPPGDLATLAGETLRGQRFDVGSLPASASCAGELAWQSH